MTRCEQKPNPGRHKRNCSVCCHLKLAEIEADFISWRSPAAIAQDYGRPHQRISACPHPWAFPERNVRGPRGKLIEQ